MSLFVGMLCVVVGMNLAFFYWWIRIRTSEELSISDYSKNKAREYRTRARQLIERAEYLDKVALKVADQVRRFDIATDSAMLRRRARELKEFADIWEGER